MTNTGGSGMTSNETTQADTGVFGSLDLNGNGIADLFEGSRAGENQDTTPGAGTDTNSGTDSSTNTGAGTTTTPEETTGTNTGGETATDVVEDEKKEDTRYDLVYKLIRKI